MCNADLTPRPCRRPLSRLALAGVTALLALLPVGAAWAQSGTARAMLDRIEALEQRVHDIETQVYRGAPPASGTPTKPAAPTEAADLEVRMMQLDQSLRGLTGQVEESDHQVQQLQQRLDQLVSEVDVRLRELEKAVSELKQGAPASASASAAPGDTAAPQPVQPVAPGSTSAAPAAAAAAPASTPAPAGAPQTAAVPAAPAPAATGAQILPPGTPAEQYSFATGLVRKRAFADAEKAFREFLELHPDDRLAPNAQYWLGETLYVRQMYQEAARNFLAGYQRYPDSGKASDSLLKLGVTLNHLGQHDEACATFDELLRRLPQNDLRLRPKAELERRNDKCN